MDQKTTQTTKEDAQRGWVLVDLTDKVLGRAASNIANILRGKNRPGFVPHLDNGDFVVVINAAKVKLTGNKLDQMMHHRHSGFFGGLTSTPAREVLAKHPDRLLREAVWGMLPKNKLSRHLMRKLKIYTDAAHPHAAQNPQTIEVS